jgi:adenine deaminase
MERRTITGHVVDVVHREVFPGAVHIEDGKIRSVERVEGQVPSHYIMPGFVDAHVHVESSMLVPSEFARLAVVHGTVGTVSDPHEIGNVLGIDGVRYMINNGKQVPFHFNFGAPSCVPATSFETAGATITKEQITELFSKDRLLYLSEMMNYPGVLARDPLVMGKIAAAKEKNLPVDGHAPGLHGEEALRYAAAGITTDHECFTLDEALGKINDGMLISIREGSAAKNYNDLHPLFRQHADKVMFCTDDAHPHDLVDHHINALVRRSIVDHGYDTMDVLTAACVRPVKHYKLDVGLLQPGDSADLIVVDSLINFSVLQTYVRGILVAEKGKSLIAPVKASIVNNFNSTSLQEKDFEIAGKAKPKRCIVALDGQLITEERLSTPKEEDGKLLPDVSQDLLKIVVVNRYRNAPVAAAFIHGFGLKEGALASCIAHDSHNIIAVGTNDADICQAVNAIIANKGGISVASNGSVDVLALPVAGIMSADDGYSVAKSYVEIDKKAKKLGTTLHAPFMTLSFMALLVIPSLKLSDKGLFNGKTFTFVEE